MTDDCYQKYISSMIADATPQIKTVVNRYIKDKETRKDAMQNCYYELFRNLGNKKNKTKITSNPKLKTYIVGMAVKIVFRFMKREKKYKSTHVYIENTLLESYADLDINTPLDPDRNHSPSESNNYNLYLSNAVRAAYQYSYLKDHIESILDPVEIQIFNFRLHRFKPSEISKYLSIDTHEIELMIIHIQTKTFRIFYNMKIGNYFNNL